MLDPNQITDDLRGLYRGSLHFDALTRGLYATDASIFEVQPLAVAVPRDADDVAVLVRYCFEHNLPVIPRGAGTGLAGESLGPAIVLDLSVHFRQIGPLEGETIRVQAGVTCDALNAALAPYGRRFAPDPASAATCTIGGMIGTNASGGNCYRYGYTRDYIAGLELVLDDGTRASVGQSEPMPEPDRLAELRRATSALLVGHRELIAQARPRTAYNRCGYLLHDVLTPVGPDLTKLLVGSEGTLAVVTAATVRTVPRAGGSCLTLLGFPTLDAAVRAGRDVRTFSPVGCDLLDRRLLAVMQRPGRTESRGQIPPSVGAALVVTIEGDTEREATERSWGLIETLRQSHLLRVLAEPTCTPAGTARIRGIRQGAAAGLYALPEGPRPVALVEDVGVPPDALPEFLAGAQGIFRRFELTASFLIHTLTGQVHTRPLVDLQLPADRSKLWPVAEAIHTLALALGGTVSTQHGTGLARTPWVERQSGSLYQVFRELKRIFDPKNLLNPGKIVGPDPSREAWPLRTAGPGPEAGGLAAKPTRPAGSNSTSPAAGGTDLSAGPFPLPTLLIWKDSTPSQEMARCTGCGDCRVAAPPKRMCPVFRATGHEAATPRAKANLLRLLTNPTIATPDEVKAVAELCVNCKMCRDECDAHVDIPKLMLEAKAAYQQEHGLSRADWILARAEGFANLSSNFAPLVNGLLARPSVRWLLEKVFGLSRQRCLPAFSLRNFFRWARGMGLTQRSTSSANRHSRPSGGRGRAAPSEVRVAYFVDVFAGYNDPLIGQAAVAVLQHNGVEVYVPPRQVGCGMAALAVGDVEAAREIALRNIRVLTDLVRDGYRIVCSEPTAALMLTQDYRDLIDDPDTATIAAHTVELTTFLHDLHLAGRLRTDFQPLPLQLGHHVPCHLKALGVAAAAPHLLGLIPGVRVHTIDAGCSGMAGTWGLKAANFAASLAAGATMFAELNRPGVLFGSTECSTCRMQMQQGSGKRTLHPVQYLAYAYGLLPEIEAKLRQPLGELVSD